MTDGINRSRHCVRRSPPPYLSLSLSLSLVRARARELVTEIRRETAAKCAHVHCARARVPIMDMQVAKQVPFIHVQSALVAYPFTISHLPFTILLSECCTCCPSPLFLILLARRPIVDHSPERRERASGTRAGRLLEVLFWRADSLRFRDAFSFSRHSPNVARKRDRSMNGHLSSPPSRRNKRRRKGMGEGEADSVTSVSASEC